MRPLVSLLVGLALLSTLPVSPAQAPSTSPSLSVTVEGFPAPVTPLKDVGITNVTVEATCPLVGTPDSPAEAAIELSVLDAPEWASLTLSPQVLPLPTLVTDPETCAGSTFTATATLTAAVSEKAPALEGAPVKVLATVRGAEEDVTAEGETALFPGYLGLLDVQSDRPTQAGPVSTEIEFPVTVVNQGNGKTMVMFELERQTLDWEVSLPDAVTLEAPLTEEAESTRTVRVVVKTPDVMSKVESSQNAVVVRVTSHHASDPKLEGDSRTLTFTATLQAQTGGGGSGGEADPKKLLPAPGLFLLVGLGAAGALLTGRRSADP